MTYNKFYILSNLTQYQPYSQFYKNIKYYSDYIFCKSYDSYKLERYNAYNIDKPYNICNNQFEF